MLRRILYFCMLCSLLFSLQGIKAEDSHQTLLEAVSADEAARQAEEAKGCTTGNRSREKAAGQAKNWLNCPICSARTTKSGAGFSPTAPQTTGVAVPIHNPIDQFIAVKWSAEDQPEVCDDAIFLRRIYLDIVGYVPPADEVEKFLKDKDPEKRSKKIDALLAMHEDYAIHWTQFWEDALCSNGRTPGRSGTRSDFQEYIIESFKQNKPYDVFVYQLLDPQSIGYRGGYVRSQTHLDSVQTAANVGQVFLGTRMKCASCHDHFLNFEWTQKRFMGFASSFLKKTSS